ncbi:MAG: AAA family ATPase [Saprospirales bacterium]|nr:AAA family ATPase [Saprospirales bacterium]
MIQRALSPFIQKAFKKMPVVAVTGPRQSGKSTLLKMLFPTLAYANLEDLEKRRFAESDPKGFLSDLGFPAVIDEIQYVPDLLSYIQVISDEQGRNGLYVISGSNNLLLMESVSQSLAGRVAIFNLLPFSLREIDGTEYRLNSWRDYIFQGFYPRIYDQDLEPSEWLADYIKTYVERDVRQLVNVSDLSAFRHFMELCAGRIGQLVNLSDIGTLVGVSYQTIKKWMSVLETGFIIHLLRPYHRNFNKRISKSPKLYFYDTGLACNLLGIRNAEELNRHFAMGALFENFVINEILKNHLNSNLTPRMYFFNAAGNMEVDLVMEQAGRLIPVEIKASQTINPAFFKNLEKFSGLAGVPADDRYVIYGGEEVQKRSLGNVLSWRKLEHLPL